MKDLFFLFLFVYSIGFFLSMLVAPFRFFIDIYKWHDREVPVKIVPSAESEVINDERGNTLSDDDELGEHDNDSNRGNELKSNSDIVRSPIEF